MSLPTLVIQKILTYNIHPIANNLKPYLTYVYRPYDVEYFYFENIGYLQHFWYHKFTNNKTLYLGPRYSSNYRFNFYKIYFYHVRCIKWQNMINSRFIISRYSKKSKTVY